MRAAGVDALPPTVYIYICTQDLEERLSRYQAKCDNLELHSTDLQKKLHQQLEDQEQMVSFLKRKAQEQTERFIDLEDRLLHAQQVKDEQQKKLEGQVAQLKEESQRALDQAVMENKILQGQLDNLELFRQNKERIEKEMVEKQEEIEKLKAEHGEELYQLEKKAVLVKDRYCGYTIDECSMHISVRSLIRFLYTIS